MKEAFVVVFMIVLYIISGCATQADIERNCKNNYEHTLLNGKKLKCYFEESEDK